MIDYEEEIKKRTAFIRKNLRASGMSKIVFANSGGKDCALTGVLCKRACDDTLGLILPCGSKRNYAEDKRDAERFAARFDIESRMIDLTPARDALINELTKTTGLNDPALINIAPRLRMAALYAVSAAESRMVAGTGNLSESFMGYFTKWGDGAYDFNPIGDLTVTEIYDFLRYLGVPEDIINKPPSGGLYDGQTDEGELGVSYKNIDRYIKTGIGNDEEIKIMERFHKTSAHKRTMPAIYSGEEDYIV